MIPIVLDPDRVPMALVGRGEALIRRLCRLQEGGARALAVFSDDADSGLAGSVGDRLRSRLPEADDLAGIRVVWIVGVSDAEAVALAEVAHQAGALVNVEDERLSCDFHNVAQVRRGDLLLTVSTGGKSPGLSARIRHVLEERFGPEWAERLDALGDRRDDWRRDRQSYESLVESTDAVIDGEGWLR